MIDMKKSKCILLTVIIMLTVLPISLTDLTVGDDPFETTVVSIDPASQTVDSDENFTVDVYCVPGQPIKAYEFKLSFDASLLQANEVTEGDIFDGYTTFFNPGTINNSAGTIIDIYGLIIGQGNVSEPGVLVNISFTSKSIDGTSSLNLYGVGVTNETAYVPISVVNGSVMVNVTPPSGLGWELLKNGTVFHMWNRYSDYYFNRSNGIQFSNHYEEYWSHNVMMLGYLTGDNLTDPDAWNLIYRTDKLSGFNEDLEDTNEYINVTLWKNLNYGSYDFRLAIRYHLGVNDTNLTVIPYIKNLGQAIPYTLGFGWELKEIQIDSTPENDYICINGTEYYLNQTLDETYVNMTIPYFEIKEDMPVGYRTLWMRWDGGLKYLVWVKNRTGQYNAPTSLFIKVGTLDVDQEKFTKIYWQDSGEVIYYFNAHSVLTEWATNPNNLDDNRTDTFASTTVPDDLQFQNSNTCPGTYLGVIGPVSIRVYGCRGGLGACRIDLVPVFLGGAGNPHQFALGDCVPAPRWSNWFIIDVDMNAPSPWTWADVQALDLNVYSRSGGLETVQGYATQIKVLYEPDITPPEITINFAGNDGDSGGPWWRPPGELVKLSGVWSDGYYANDSRQEEDWIYIDLTVTDSEVDVGCVWFNWLNETTWTNWTYGFTNPDGDHWVINTSENFSTASGYNYSFDIVANDTYAPGNINSNITAWNKTGIDGNFTRRWVQLNCTQTNISYSPFYFYNASRTPDDNNKQDRLHHDQGANNTIHDTGYLLSAIPDDTVTFNWCTAFLGYWFDESVCISTGVNNIYYHVYWATDNRIFDEIGWGKSRASLDGESIESYATEEANNRTSIFYDNGFDDVNNTYFLDTNLLEITPTSFTDNDIYELQVVFRSSGEHPSCVSNRSYTSFIIPEVPNNETLNASHPDTDSDGRSDWEELYVDYTNPFLADTDNDGANDTEEYLSGSDPNNYTDTTPFAVNNPPVQTSPCIWNVTTSENKSLNATNVDLFPTCFNVTVNDTDGDYMNVSILTNESGSWAVVNATASGMLNGTFSGYNTSWVDSYSTKYWISFNVSDDEDWCNTTYNFTTTPSLIFDINRTSFAFGAVQNDTIVYSNATQPDTFRIYNNGTAYIDIDVNGTNATASGETDWNLSSSNGDNQYKMEIYNSSTSWVQINKTADTWYSNMAQSTNITANIRITTPTIFYSGKQMTCSIYMTASIH